MKIVLYSSKLIFLLILSMLWACNSDESNNQKLPIDNTEEITQEDTTTRLCYMLNIKGLEEIVQLKITGDKIEGTGRRVHKKLTNVFNLQINGTIKNGTADVGVTAIENKKDAKASTIYETWELKDKIMTVKKRKYLDKQGDLDFIRINCPSTPNEERDSSLFDYFGGFFEGYAVVGRGNYYGLVNEDWEVTIPCKYIDLEIVNEGSIVFFDEKKGRKGMLDVNGNILQEAEYDNIHCYNEGLAAFLKDGRWGFLDKAGNVAIEPKFLEVNIYQTELTRHPFNEGLANVKTPNGRWNYINKNGDVVIEGNYILAKHFVDGKAEVYKNTKSYFIDKTGECVENCD